MPGFTAVKAPISRYSREAENVSITGAGYGNDSCRGEFKQGFFKVAISRAFCLQLVGSESFDCTQKYNFLFILNNTCELVNWKHSTCRKIHKQMHYIPIAFVSSLLALRIENLNFARTSLLLQASNRRYNDK